MQNNLYQPTRKLADGTTLRATAAAARWCHGSATGSEQRGEKEGVALGTVGSKLENAGEGIHTKGRRAQEKADVAWR